MGITVAGIDPGQGGAVVFITTEHHDQAVHPPPALHIHDTPLVGDAEYDVGAMADLFRPYLHQSLQVVMEKVHSMPTQGVRSMFSMGYGFGLWRGIMAALHVPYELVTPQAWRKAMLAGLPNGAGEKDQAKRKRILKQTSVQQAQRLAPRYATEFVGPKGGLLDGRAEAYLMAEYLRRRYL